MFELTPEQWLEQGQAGRGRKKEPFRRTLMPVEEVACYRDGRKDHCGWRTEDVEVPPDLGYSKNVTL